MTALTMTITTDLAELQRLSVMKADLDQLMAKMDDSDFDPGDLGIYSLDFINEYGDDLLATIQAALNDAQRYIFLRDTEDPNWRPYALRHGVTAAASDALVDEAIAKGRV